MGLTYDLNAFALLYQAHKNSSNMACEVRDAEISHSIKLAHLITGFDDL